MTAVNYLWNPINDNIVREFDDAGNTIAEYTTEPDLYGNVVSQFRNGQTSYLLSDGQGNTTELTNDAGNVTDTIRYSAFGEVTQRTGSTEIPFQYVGQKGYYRDNETGYCSIRQRPLSHREGRWQTVDPLHSEGGDINLYRYVHNTPLLMTDPSGLMCYVCNTSAYYAGRLATLDALADGSTPFTDLYNYLVGGMNRPNIGITIEPPAFGSPNRPGRPPKRAGVLDAFNVAVPATGMPANVIRAAYYLFYVVFDVCESPAGSCRIFLDETGSKVEATTDIENPAKDYGDITGAPDVAIANSKHPVWSSDGSVLCNKLLIYADSPGNFAVWRLVPGSGQLPGLFKLTVKQKITIKDSATMAVVSTFSHTVIIGVDGINKKIISSP